MHVLMGFWLMAIVVAGVRRDWRERALVKGARNRSLDWKGGLFRAVSCVCRIVVGV